MIAQIEKYIHYISGDYDREKSWEHCFDVFSNDKAGSLNLAFYLASWGMYRGSSGLLQKNHLVHDDALDILFKEEYQALKCSPINEVNNMHISSIMRLKEELIKHYEQDKFAFVKKEVKRKITATDTLISKIMLGTLGCVGAYDRYFISGLKAEGMKHYSFKKESLTEIFVFIEKHKEEIEACRKLIEAKTKVYYPTMKIVDMYFWQKGFEEEQKNEAINLGKN